MAKTRAKTIPTHKPATKPPKAADKAQFERFVEAAREIGVDESPEALDHAFDRVRPKKS